MKKIDASQDWHVIAARAEQERVRNAPAPTHIEDNPNFQKAMKLIGQGKKVLPIGPDGKPLTCHGSGDDPLIDPSVDATAEPLLVRWFWTLWPDARCAVVEDEEPKA